MIRSTLRAVGWFVSELIPAQAIRCCLDRDYSNAIYQAGRAFDGAEQRAECEAEEEVSEPCEMRCAAAASVGGEPFLCGKERSHIGPHSNTHYRTLWLGPEGSRAEADELFAAGEEGVESYDDDPMVSDSYLRYNEDSRRALKEALWPDGKAFDGYPEAEAARRRQRERDTKSSADGSAQGPADGPPEVSSPPSEPSGGHSDFINGYGRDEWAEFFGFRLSGWQWEVLRSWRFDGDVRPLDTSDDSDGGDVIAW